jgi:hypothetical protein
LRNFGYGGFLLRRLRASLTYANVMSTVAAFAAITGGAYAVAAIPDSGGKVNACYFKSGQKKGQLRLLVSGTNCRKGETKVSWNQQGLQGLQGLAGQQGERGLAGSDAQLPPVEALRAVAPAPATANCGPSNPATAVFCALGANGWQWQNSAAGGPPVAFFKDRSGVVHVQGGAQQVGPTGLPIFVLPPGYRPSATLSFVVRDENGPSASLPPPAPPEPFNYVTILSDGRINRATNGSAGYLSLDGIDFRAEQ